MVLVLLVWLICRVLRLFSGMLAADITSMPTVAPGDTITAAGWNVITANIALLGGRTGGDPGSTGKIQQSTGTLAGGWTTPVDSTVLSDRKVSAAGDTMSGNLTVPNLTSNNTVVTAGSVTVGNAMAAVGGVSGATVAASNTVSAGGSITAGNAISAVGILSGASAAIAGAISAASSTLTGLLTAANVTATNALAAGGSITAGNAISAVGALSGASAALTGAISAASGSISGVLNAGTLQQGGTAIAALFAAIGHTHTAMAKVATGSYAGNSGTRVITGLGFTPKSVFIINSTTGNTGGFLQNGVSIAMTGSGGIGSGTGTMDADGFTLSGASGVNASGNNYAYVAYG